MANVFTASQNMSVRAVSTETSEPGTTVTYEVYRLNKNASDPKDGELLTEFEKTYTYGGYHKENLDKSYPIAAGESYSVVVTLRFPDGNYGVLYSTGFNKDFSEQFDSSIYFVAIVNPGESFLFYQNGWIDLCDNIKSLEERGYVCDNFSIKAYADPEETPELSLTQEIVNPMDVYHIGDIITFHTTVSNNSIFDVNIQLVSSLTDLGEKANAEIKAGDIYEFDYEYTVQEADIENGSLVNQLTLSLLNDSDFSTVISELAVNVTEVQDVTDATGATDATEATDTTEVSDATEVTEATKAATEVSDATEATETTNVTDTSNIVTSSDSKNVTSVNSSSSNSVQTGDSSFVVFTIVILFAASAVVYFARKKSNF